MRELLQHVRDAPLARTPAEPPNQAPRRAPPALFESVRYRSRACGRSAVTGRPVWWQSSDAGGRVEPPPLPVGSRDGTCNRQRAKVGPLDLWSPDVDARVDERRGRADAVRPGPCGPGPAREPDPTRSPTRALPDPDKATRRPSVPQCLPSGGCCVANPLQFGTGLTGLATGAWRHNNT